jgi:hypothetical protein
MMRLARRASLLVARSLLTLTATAYAECALSDNPTIPASGNWIPEGAFKTKEECVGDIKSDRH